METIASSHLKFGFDLFLLPGFIICLLNSLRCKHQLTFMKVKKKGQLLQVCKSSNLKRKPQASIHKKLKQTATISDSEVVMQLL